MKAVSSQRARSPVELIAKKRDGGRLSTEELRAWVTGVTSGSLPDYQLAAFLMAVYFQGLDDDETVALTEAMLHSGRVLDLSRVPGTKVDKHSTGGVGDKVSICLAPLVAACGVPVPMMSGRGLGHTGGTLDKLDAIPGFRTQLSAEEFERILATVGTAMLGQTHEIAPADKRLYALRDVTGTVESIPLIVASILSKKLAEGIDALVLDVKVGRGAFMKNEARARELAEKLVRVGQQSGKKVTAVLTRMEAPLGRQIGNANETREAIELLHGRSSADLLECTLALGAEMLVLGGRESGMEQAEKLLRQAIESGTGVQVLARLIEAQGGDPAIAEHPERLALAPEERTLSARQAGFVHEVDAYAFGLAAVQLGAGRTRTDQAVDPGVGIELLAKPGTRVAQGDPLARIWARSPLTAEDTLQLLAPAFRIEEAKPVSLPLVLGQIRA